MSSPDSWQMLRFPKVPSNATLIREITIGAEFFCAREEMTNCDCNLSPMFPSDALNANVAETATESVNGPNLKTDNYGCKQAIKGRGCRGDQVSLKSRNTITDRSIQHSK